MAVTSRFNLFVDLEETGEHLVFNTRTGALLAFPAAAGTALESFRDGADTSELDPSLARALAENDLVAEAGSDHEVDSVLAKVASGIADGNRLDVFILPNMNCNFECPYCYEDHRVSQMSDEVADRIVQWFEHVVPRFKVVLVSWFGGEPLLSFDRMCQLQAEFVRICEASGVRLNSHVTTNGYLLNHDRADALCELGIKSYQITVDGPPEIHNQSRVLRGPGDSFDRVFGNLCDLAERHPDTNIKLRVNFDPNTLRRVPELLEMVPERLRSRMHLVLERIFGQGTLFVRRSQQNVADEIEVMYEVARSMGFAITTTPLDASRLTYCYADRENEFLFTHVGDVFKCTVSSFDSADRLGFLDESGRINWEDGAYDDWMGVPVIDDACRRCPYLPMCMGGCRKNRYHRGRASDDCTLPFAALETRIRQRHLRSLTTHAH